MNKKHFEKPANSTDETVIQCGQSIGDCTHNWERGRMERGNDYEWFSEDEERTYYDPYTGQEISEREYWDNGCSDEMMDNLF
ncbi:hypothetical protein ACFQO8_03775 [Exiguobacterium aestuarii]|uniref:Uncharacterized protein n=1 Tax=Exiguobacterium aestuarii TaxID=273527 RepID=A0ABW2PNL1_9BACL|nr:MULTISPECIES: hypothetical protein [Exiguobacterium]MCT4786596.1 hypothetical protein [Exiguobacterium aestuarii]